MNKKGFTLIELLIVVAIIGIVAAIAIPNLMIALHKGKQKSTMGDMHSHASAIDAYIVDWAQAPSDAGFLSDSIDTAWFRPFYIKVVITHDSWGTVYDYQSQASGLDSYSIESWGKNKIDGPVPPVPIYPITAVGHFNFDIVISNGRFTVGPRVKK